MGIANTAGRIISHTTVISIAYLASPDSSGSLEIIIISGGQGSKRLNNIVLLSQYYTVYCLKYDLSCECLL